MRLPRLAGEPIRVAVRTLSGSHWAETSIPDRAIWLDTEVLTLKGEFERILIHELFHFTWVRLSNQTRWSWEHILQTEFAEGSKGELGWSAEWRKQELRAVDRRRRTPAWRRYICESFCDSAASYYAGLTHHDEFTLATPHRRRRRAWFVKTFATGAMPV